MKNSRLILKSLLVTTLLTTGTGLYLSSNTPAEAATLSSTPKSATTGKSITTLKLKWQTKADEVGLYNDHPPLSNGLLFFSKGGNLHAVDIATGTVKWTYRNGGTPEIVTRNSVFLINNEGYLVKVEAKTGKLLWKVKAAKPPIEIGAFAELLNGTIYFRNESGGIAAYHPVSGHKLWENKKIPMYVGSIIGQYKKVLVVKSTVNNIRTQFFGLDPTRGTILWRSEGIYSFVAYRDGQLILRQQANAPYSFPITPVPGYLVTLTKVDVTTGKVIGEENYKTVTDLSRMGNKHTSLQGSYVYSVDSNMDKDEAFLNRFTLGQASETPPKSYEEFGKWVAGPTHGMIFFQKGTQITEVNIYNNKIVTFDSLAGSALNLQLMRNGVYTGDDKGNFYIINVATGTILGKLKTDAGQYGKVNVVNNTVLIHTEYDIYAVTLPKELQ
ncbi:PQQ-binding-like beta-propeller repeat protein [Paenibacillus sp. 19GGS1-52]|uniref:PQQ-binding-like beta-propeller repeat protein n=1 Tax=Paenibacillus sp. 19GGS1-52 TaxID=2758563 RepID=UPI001EFC256F|nr:PQQ-binding-like beta-propeller repeat protein [Paenibacillus sp. 19GGS1-52]ULO10085.1 PQQ-binding-like beta-propeller repeat protein [Paenibacillus sp. 19GGS1-52]